MELTMFKKVLLLFAGLLPSIAFAARYPMPNPGNDLIGSPITVSSESGQSISDIGDKYGVGLHEMLEANPQITNPNELSGEEVIIPTQFVLPKYRKGIVINIAECRLYYFTPDGKSVITYPVGLGRKGWRTPTTSTTVIRKTSNPVWTVPSSIRAYVYEQTGNWLPDTIQPGPENPLGHYALYLGTNGYLIHGTNQPWSIGKLISAGCIRLYNQDVQELYSHVTTGTPVRIIHQPYKAGYQNGKLYLEAHIPLNLSEPPGDLNIISVERSVLAANHKPGDVNWQEVRRIAEQQNGMPEPVTNPQLTVNDQDF
jgi:L,D-transpeptidase ErfK/SrfK